MEEVERRRKPKPSVQGPHEELSTELTPLSGKKAIFIRDALMTTIASSSTSRADEKVKLRLP